VPVFLFDPIKKAIGIVHAGWKGTHKEITFKTILEMKSKFGCHPQDLKVVLGPSIRAYSYEVGPEFKDYFPQDIIERGGKLYVDVSNNNRRQLLKAECRRLISTIAASCTYANPKYFSFRRDADKAGRMISLMSSNNMYSVVLVTAKTKKKHRK